MTSTGEAEEGLFLGIDLGTSGCRAVVINQAAEVVANHALSWESIENHVVQTPFLWWQGVCQLFEKLWYEVPLDKVRAISADGTSGSVFFTAPGDKFTTIGPVLMYNDNRATEEADYLATIAPPDSPVLSASSGLAKLLWLQKHHNIPEEAHFHTQTDWLLGLLANKFMQSDENNALKTGYDPQGRHWAEWLRELDFNHGWLPLVDQPGTEMGYVDEDIAHQFGFSNLTWIMTGTTDSTAAFMATGACEPGDAITSLGSTLVLKVVSEEPVADASAGVYSQPLPGNSQQRLWLVGGASNSGGQVLREYFTDEQMAAMTAQLDFDQPTGLDYYPLIAPGERFPVNDPSLTPRLAPRPDDDLRFFQAILEGIAHIEQTGYEKLVNLGAPRPTSIRTVGGGAVNQPWTKLRSRLLNVPIQEVGQTDAAYGAALLARKQTIIEGLEI